MNYFMNVMRNYAKFDGVLSVREYWMFVLFYYIFACIAAVLSLIIFPLAYIFSLAMLIPSIAATIRRLRDAGQDPLWILIGLVPLVGWIILIVMLCKPTR